MEIPVKRLVVFRILIASLLLQCFGSAVCFTNTQRAGAQTILPTWALDEPNAEMLSAWPLYGYLVAAVGVRFNGDLLSATMLSQPPAPQAERELVEEHYKRGAAEVGSGQLTVALEEFQAAIRLAPEDARGWKGLGIANGAAGDFSSAEPALRKACDLDPGDEDSCYLLGRASYELNRFAKALEAYQKALRSATRIARVHSGLALTLEALGRNEEAERELREAIRLDDGKSLPGSDPRIELGAFLLRQGRLNEALTALRAAVKARPDSARAHFELGRAMLQVDRLEDASGQLRQAIALNANYAPAHLLLGKVYFRMGCRAEGALQTRLGQKLTAPQP